MGWRVEHPPLPRLRPGVPASVHLTVRPGLPDRAAPSSEVETHEAFEREPKNRIRVARQLVNPHSLVNHTAAVLRAKKPDSYGTIGIWREKCLDLRVSPKTLDRGLRIMNALLTALEARGFRITVSATDKLETHVTVLGEPLQLRLEEKINRTPHVPTKEEARYPSSAPRWDYAPSGDLTLRIHEYWPRGTRKSWSDGRRKKLDQMLNDVVRGLVIVADAKRAERIEQERAEKERQEAARQRALIEQRRREEEERLRTLERQAESWAKAQKLRAFVDEVERQANSKGISLAPGSKLVSWTEWAREHADHLDPIKLGSAESSEADATEPSTRQASEHGEQQDSDFS